MDATITVIAEVDGECGIRSACCNVFASGGVHAVNSTNCMPMLIMGLIVF